MEVIVRSGPELYFHQGLPLWTRVVQARLGSVTSMKWCFWGVGERKKRPKQGVGLGPILPEPHCLAPLLPPIAVVHGRQLSRWRSLQKPSLEAAVNTWKMMWPISTYRACKMDWCSAHKVVFCSLGVTSNEPIKGLHKTVKNGNTSQK